MKEVHLCMFFKKLHGGKNVITKNNVLIVYMAESEFNLLDRKAKQLKTTKSEPVRRWADAREKAAAVHYHEP